MNTFKKLISTTALTLVLGVSALAQHKDIVDIAAGNPQFSTLVSLVKKAGLVDVLKGSGPFTVFAPTNEAFAKLPKATLEAVGSNKDFLVKVLTYHVVAGKVTASDVVKLKSAKTVEGSSVHIRVKKGKVMINKSVVTKTDIMASNGVIHVIDSVLIPADIAKPKTQASTCTAGN